MPAVSSWSDPGDAVGLVALRHSVGDAEVIALNGGLCAAAVDALPSAIAKALDDGRRHVVLDLHEVRDADADGLWVLSAAMRAAIRRGGRLSAVGLRPALRPQVEPLVADGLSLHPTVRSAVADPAKPKAPR